MVPLADHHWSRASASCRARCSPYRRSEVLRASQLPALLILRQPTYPFPSRSSASSPSAFFRIVSFRIFFFSFSHVRSIFSDSTFFFWTFLYTDFRFYRPQTQFSRASSCADHIRFRFGIPETFPNRDVFSCVLAYLYIFCCIVAAVVAMMACTFFRISAHTCVRWHRSIVHIIYVGFYYLRWHRFFFFRVPIGMNVFRQALIGR